MALVLDAELYYIKDFSSDFSMKEISLAKLQHYFDVTKRALAKVKIVQAHEQQGKDFLDMATRYYADATWFFKKDDYVHAFAALNYAHGWLDAGARARFFDVDGDSELFTVDKEWAEHKTQCL